MRSLFTKMLSTVSIVFLSSGAAQASTLVHEVGGELGATVHADHVSVSKTRGSVTQELMQARAKYPAWNQQLMGAPNETARAAPRSREDVAREARAAVASNSASLREHQ
jgi:hypothetical protein